MAPGASDAFDDTINGGAFREVVAPSHSDNEHMTLHVLQAANSRVLATTYLNDDLSL